MNNIEDIIISMLLSGHEYYGSFLSRIQTIKDNNIPTLATTFEKGYLTLRYNLKYLQSLKISEQIACIEHELHHVIYEYWDRKQSRDNKIWNQSHDIAINQLIDNLPEDALKPSSYPKSYNLPDNENGEVYYNHLIKHCTTISIDKNGNVSINGKQIGKICQRQENNFTEAEKEIIKREVLKSSYYGNTPQEVERLIEEITKKPPLNWKSILRQEISSSIKTESKKSWKRYSRKLGEEYRGKIKNRVPKIVVCIDTSGSIGSEQFNQFITEIQQIQKNYKNDFLILEGDAALQKEYLLKKFTKVDKSMKGGGGTDFRPLINRCIKEKPNLVIFFTDTYGTFPSKKPNFKVLWISLNKGDVPFGKLVVIEKGGEK